MGGSVGDDARVGNEVGAVSGNNVQAGAIHGDVHFHQASAADTVPRQLPGATRHFVNRAVEQDALTTLLASAKTEGVVLVSTIDGTAGVGKSTLAVHWAHQMRGRFPDGELYVNLRGFDPIAEPMRPADALGTFLAALDVPPERIPDDVDARAAMFRTSMHDKRMLVLLDNARSADQVRPLLPGGHTSLVLVTSRNRLDDLVIREGASRMTLNLLMQEESRDLLVRYLGQDRVNAEPDAVNALIEQCAGLPLALGIVAVSAAEDPAFPLAELVSELHDERERLDALDAGGESGVRAVFSWSYRSLSADAARLFRLMGLPTGPDISLAAVADLAGTTQRKARRLLVELTRAHLVDQHEPGRYRFHDLLRAYAAECAANDETPEDRQAAIRRLLDHYLRTSYAADQHFTGHARKFVPDLPESKVHGLTFADDESALGWWETERPNLLAAIRQASMLGLDQHTSQLPRALMYFFHLRTQTDDWFATYERALAASRKLGDRAQEAQLTRELCIAYYDLKQYDAAARQAELALPLLEEVDDKHGQSESLVALGLFHIDSARYREASPFLTQALDLVAAMEDDFLQGQVQGALGLLHAKLGHFDQAWPHFEEALRLYRNVGEDYGTGFVLNNLANAYMSAGQTDDAVITYRRAATYRREIGHRQGEAESLRGLGTALRMAGDVEAAREALEAALVVFEEMDQPEADEVRAELEALTTS